MVISLVLDQGEEFHVASPPFSQHQDSRWLEGLCFWPVSPRPEPLLFWLSLPHIVA